MRDHPRRHCTAYYYRAAVAYALFLGTIAVLLLAKGIG